MNGWAILVDESGVGSRLLPEHFLTLEAAREWRDIYVAQFPYDCRTYRVVSVGPAEEQS